jgi:LacI family gluconate utilization system Gnt-I transcriptional repressor
MNPADSDPKKSRPKKSGGLTLKDVARLAGVSPISASRALSTPDAVSDELLQKVKAAVQLTGYVPNMIAGGLASKNSKLVAAVVPTISGPVFQEMVQSLTETLAAAGYQVMLGQSGYENSREDALLDAIIGRRPAGVVLTGIMRSPDARKKLLNSGVPVVETWDLTPTPIDMLVGFSHDQIGADVAQYLHDRGRRRVAVISGSDERSQRRSAAFCAAAVRLGMTRPGEEVPNSTVGAPTTLGDGRRALLELRTHHPDIDAIFCSSDLLALGVITEAMVWQVQIPEQLAVVGFGDMNFARDLHPALTTVRIDGASIGTTAAQFILDRMAGKEVAQPVRDIGFQIIERASA